MSSETFALKILQQYLLSLSRCNGEESVTFERRNVTFCHSMENSMVCTKVYEMKGVTEISVIVFKQ